MQPSETKRDSLSLKKILNSKWAVWGVVLLAIVLLCITATVAFAIKKHNTPKPVTIYSPMNEIEARYGMTNLQVTSSNGLGVDAGNAPVATPVTGASAAATQSTAPKIGPAPSAAEVPALQSVTNGLSNNPVTLQTDVNVLGSDGQANGNSSNVLDTNVTLGL